MKENDNRESRVEERISNRGVRGNEGKLRK